MNYEKAYYFLFNSITDEINNLYYCNCKKDVNKIIKSFQKAQKTSEQMFINED